MYDRVGSGQEGSARGNAATDPCLLGFDVLTTFTAVLATLVAAANTYMIVRLRHTLMWQDFGIHGYGKALTWLPLACVIKPVHNSVCPRARYAAVVLCAAIVCLELEWGAAMSKLSLFESWMAKGLFYGCVA